MNVAHAQADHPRGELGDELAPASFAGADRDLDVEVRKGEGALDQGVSEADASPQGEPA